jgi:hypothetical protein
MGNCREIDAYYFGSRNLQQCEKALAYSRRGVNINPAVQARQGAIVVDSNVDSRLIDAFDVVAQQRNRFPSSKVLRGSEIIEQIRNRYSDSQFEFRLWKPASV